MLLRVLGNFRLVISVSEHEQSPIYLTPSGISIEPVFFDGQQINVSILRSYKIPSYSLQKRFLSDSLNAFVSIACKTDVSNSSLLKSKYKTSQGISHPLCPSNKLPLFCTIAPIECFEWTVILSNRQFSGISTPEILTFSGISISFADVSISTIIPLIYLTPFTNEPPS